MRGFWVVYDFSFLLRDENEDNERGPLFNEIYDTKYAKSFRHLTREALPRVDNYRNIMSIHAAPRPTLDELHEATVHGKVIWATDVGRCWRAFGPMNGPYRL